MEYRVWIGNPWALWYDWSKLRAEVERLFAPAIELNKKFKTLQVQNIKVAPSVADHDLLIYIVPSAEHGFVGRGFGPPGEDDKLLKEHTEDGEPPAGLTLPWGGRTCSEVFVGNSVSENSAGEYLKVEKLKSGKTYIDRKRSPEEMAVFIYHEALHNKTGLGNKGLHNRGGLAKAKINQFTERTEANSKLMADYLGKKRPQWTLAWQELASRG